MFSIQVFKEFAVARSIPLSFPWVPKRASKTAANTVERRRSTDAEASKPLAGMLLAAVLAAFLVVADQLIETWANGHLLLMWVALWTVAFAALALLAPPLRHLANALAKHAARGSQARAQRRADEAMWQHAQTDARVMHDIQAAMTRSPAAD